jgi:hypothetical protein
MHGAPGMVICQSASSFRRFRPVFFSCGHVGAAGPGEDRQDAFDIVAADEVEHGIEIFRRVIFDEPRQFGIHAPRIFGAGHEVDHQGALGVVHGAVDIVAAEVFPLFAVADLVRRIFPDFADEDGIGLFLFQGMVELAQEGYGQLVDDVQSPAADAFVQPVFEDAVFAVDDENPCTTASFLLRPAGPIRPTTIHSRRDNA